MLEKDLRELKFILSVLWKFEIFFTISINIWQVVFSTKKKKRETYNTWGKCLKLKILPEKAQKF